MCIKQPIPCIYSALRFSWVRFLWLKKSIRIIESSHLKARKDTKSLVHCCSFAYRKVGCRELDGLAHTCKAGQ